MTREKKRQVEGENLRVIHAGDPSGREALFVFGRHPDGVDVRKEGSLFAAFDVEQSEVFGRFAHDHAVLHELSRSDRNFVEVERIGKGVQIRVRA